MNENLPDKSNLPALTSFCIPHIEFQTRLEEICGSIKNTMVKIDEIMKPLVDCITTIKVNYNGFSTVFLNATRTIEAIRRMGQEQFVCGDFFPKNLLTELWMLKMST